MNIIILLLRTCCWEATPRPPPFTVLANIATSTAGSSSPSSITTSQDRELSPEPQRTRGTQWPVLQPPPFIVRANSRESKDSQSPTDLPLDEPPLMDAANDLASDNWSNTGLNRSSRNWSTSEACDGTRTRLTCDAINPKQKSRSR